VQDQNGIMNGSLPCVRTPSRYRNDDGSLPLALMLSIVSLGLCTAVASSLINSVMATRTEDSRAQAVMAAQGDLEVAVAHIRAARDENSGLLDLGRLCDIIVTPGNPVSIGPARADVSVNVSYYATDPLMSGSTALPCADLAPHILKFALLETTIPGDGTRRLTATYVFRTATSDGGLRDIRETGPT
jgi:hypothetical protein